MSTLAQLLERSDATIAQARELLNGLSPAGRVSQVTELTRKHQERLWELAEPDPKRLTLDYLVPRDAEPLKPVPFEGKNSLPMFTRFRKVFYRTPDRRVAGYNDQAMAWVTGPGYFVVRDSADDNRGPIVIDYTLIPDQKPRGWPEIKRNEAGLSRFVYGGNHDFMRYVTDDVIIGRAFKAADDRAMPNWFVLVRPGS